MDLAISVIGCRGELHTIILLRGHIIKVYPPPSTIFILMVSVSLKALTRDTDFFIRWLLIQRFTIIQHTENKRLRNAALHGTSIPIFFSQGSAITMEKRTERV